MEKDAQESSGLSSACRRPVARKGGDPKDYPTLAKMLHSIEILLLLPVLSCPFGHRRLHSAWYWPAA